jgi:copper chaperone CopZ
MHCSSCEDYVKSVLSGVPHLKDLSVNVLQRSLTFAVDFARDDHSSRESLVRAVQLLLDASGYASYRPRNSRASFFRRLMNAVLGKERRLRERHLAHCAACQAEQDPSRADKDEGPSLTTIKVDNRAAPKLVETRLAIEGMTCRFAILSKIRSSAELSPAHALISHPYP